MKRPAPLSASEGVSGSAASKPVPSKAAKGKRAGAKQAKANPTPAKPTRSRPAAAKPIKAKTPAAKPAATNPSRPARSPRPVRPEHRQPTQSAPRRVDVRGWLGGLRLSGFTMIMLGLVILAVCVLVPTVSTYVGQQQQIAALQHSVQVTKDDVAALERERTRWKDPAYITTQARQRLYYVKPGDVVYLVIDDLPASRLPQQRGTVSKTVEQTKTDWTSQLVTSVVAAGTAKIAATK